MPTESDQPHDEELDVKDLEWINASGSEMQNDD